MGQYLSIGLVTECGCSKKKLEQQNVTQEELIDGMKNKLHFDPTIYNLSEVNDNYLFTLKPDVLAQQLIPFLEKLYPLLYSDTTDYQQALDALKKNIPRRMAKPCRTKTRSSISNRQIRTERVLSLR